MSKVSAGGYQGNRKVVSCGGWQRHALLGDGDLPVRRTIAKAFGLDAATRIAFGTCIFTTLRLPWAGYDEHSGFVVGVHKAYVPLVKTRPM
ncbi:MAG: hypothetical protein A2Y77_12430 [Planctomycetes bacterium RBG_13_62_9]|nr:MAG: hypothetical protein A2Y77_12430 [Planctomycetes bacterium RBG_13_62_9]